MFEEEEDVEDDEGWDEEGDDWQQQLPLFSRCVEKSLLFDVVQLTISFLYVLQGAKPVFSVSFSFPQLFATACAVLNPQLYPSCLEAYFNHQSLLRYNDTV